MRKYAEFTLTEILNWSIVLVILNFNFEIYLYLFSCIVIFSLFTLQVSVDRARNVPWSNFTLALASFNPPGAYYYGSPWAKYDHPIFIENIDFNSLQKCPMWLDNFKVIYIKVLVHAL